MGFKAGPRGGKLRKLDNYPGGPLMTAELLPLVREALCGELDKLRDEVKKVIEPLSDAELWQKPIEPGNSIGHLVLHLTGNLSHFVGAQLGKTGYVREREREFTEANLPSRAELLAGLDGAVATFRQVVGGLSAEQLAAPHPEARLGQVLPGLLHLLLHFALHRGQMSYLSRLVKPTAK
jgi:uncharacterized damage-inducible protein DinB